MKTTTCFLLLLTYTFCFLLFASADTVTLHVAPHGNDAWTGRTGDAQDGDGPVASLTRAQGLVREMRVEGRTGISVVIQDGVYWLTGPLVFGPEDSGTADDPVKWIAAEGARPMVSGGRELTGWRQTEEGLWELVIPEVRDGQWFFHQLFLGEERLKRCRWPSEGYLRSAGPFVPRMQRHAPGWDNPEARIGFSVDPDDIPDSDDLHSAVAFVFHAWTASVHWIDTIDAATRALRFTAGSQWPMGHWERNQRYYIENIRTALREPGTWYLNRRSGQLLYMPRPGERIEAFRPVAPVLGQIVRVEGVPDSGQPAGHLVFRGLSFRHNRFDLPFNSAHDGQAGIFFALPGATRELATMTGAVHTRHAVNVHFEDVEIAQVGTYGLWFAEGTRDNTLIRSELRDLGAGGVKIGTRSVESGDFPSFGNRVENCFLHDGGHLSKAGVGVWIGHSSYHEIRRNEIMNFDYTGISVGWNWGYRPSSANHNLIEYNRIHHIGNGVLSDMGGIYTLGVSPGTIVRGNVIHDVHAYSYGGWGLYPDEGSSEILFERNLVYRTKSGGFHQHFGRENKVRHNIFAFAGEGQIRRSREEEHSSFTFTRNIVLTDNGRVLSHAFANGQFDLDYNLYWDSSDQPFRILGLSFDEWQALGHDTYSMLADPEFRDPENDDFYLPDQSPARALGIEPLQDLSKVGLYGPAEWVARPRAVAPRPLDPAMRPPAPAEEDGVLQFRIVEDFNELPEGAFAPFAGTRGEEQGASIRVVPNPVGSGHVLAFRDAPGLSHTWQPHLSGALAWADGVGHASFDLWLGPGAIFWHEWRDGHRPYRVGPSLRFANGVLRVGGQRVATIPVGEWINVEIRSPLGDAAVSGQFDLTVTAKDDTTPIFHGTLPFRSADWRTLNTVIWSSEADAETVFYLDNVRYQLR